MRRERRVPDRASNAALWITIGCAVVFIGVLFVVPALTSAPTEESAPQSKPVAATAPVPEPASTGREDSIHPAQAAVQLVDERLTSSKAAPPTEARAETVATPVPAVQSIRMFPPFPDGRIKWEGFDLRVVPASRENVRAYRSRMAEFYDEFDRAAKCRTQQERAEQAGRFIITCDSKIGFDEVVVPDSYVEWTKLFVQVIQIRAESMYFAWGAAETEFLAKHKQGEIHAQANALLETLTKRQTSR